MPHEHHGAFGQDAFGRGAERAARFFGTPQYIVGQTLLVVAWIIVNSLALTFEWDPYPFILLNLAFSTQAAYAAPLILLAQTRQADRDRIRADAEQRHRDETTQTSLAREEQLKRLIEENTELTQRVEALAREIRERVGLSG
jgi:uncharacterized membrane protein